MALKNLKFNLPKPADTLYSRIDLCQKNGWLAFITLSVYWSIGHLLIAKLSNDLIYLITSEHMFAVVRWSEGEDSGKLSEVNTDTIRRYDDSKMDQHGNPISTYSAVIEWCHGKKQQGGWPHYRGTVAFVSGKLVLLWF